MKRYLGVDHSFRLFDEQYIWFTKKKSNVMNGKKSNVMNGKKSNVMNENKWNETIHLLAKIVF
jgi:hypothetical protein